MIKTRIVSQTTQIIRQKHKSEDELNTVHARKTHNIRPKKNKNTVETKKSYVQNTLKHLARSFLGVPSGEPSSDEHNDASSSPSQRCHTYSPYLVHVVSSIARTSSLSVMYVCARVFMYIRRVFRKCVCIFVEWIFVQDVFGPRLCVWQLCGHLCNQPCRVLII